MRYSWSKIRLKPSWTLARTTSPIVDFGPNGGDDRLEHGVVEGACEFGPSLIHPCPGMAESIEALLQEVIVSLVQFDLDLPKANTVARAAVDGNQVVVELGQRRLLAALENQPAADRLQRW